jgi:N-acetylglucosamine kinase-like BadF-type ATPase
VSVVAVDTGRSTCRAAVFADPLQPVAEQSTTVVSEATLVDPDGPSRVAATVTAALAALHRWRQPGPSTLVVAAAGCLTRPDAGAVLAEQLAGALAAPSRWGLGSGIERVIVASDVVASHAAAFDGAPGVVLAAGTGAVALALDPRGRHALVDGGGYLIGDAGSGFAVGRAGLAAALRHLDGRPGGSAALAAAASARFAPPGGTLRDVAAALYGGSDPTRRVARVASFTPDVAAVARAGDPVAVTIWQQAVAELAETITAACAGLPGTGGQVALVGNLFEIEDLLVAPLRAAVAAQSDEITLRTGSGDALLGAARLARTPAGGYEPLLLVRSVG